MGCHSQLLDENDFGRAGVVRVMTHQLRHVRAIAIGPDSEFDSCRLVNQGGVVVSRERPFVGDIDVNQLQVEPVRGSASPTTAEPDPITIVSQANLDGFFGRLQLQVFDHPIAIQPTKRSPIRRYFRQVDINTATDVCRAIIRGRDEIFFSIYNDDSTEPLRFFAKGGWHAFEGGNEGLAEFDLVPDDLVTTGQVFGAIAAGEAVHFNATLKGLDYVYLRLDQDTGGAVNGVAIMEAFDR